MEELYWHHFARQGKQEVLLVVVVFSRPVDDFPHPPAHPEQVSVEAELPVPVAAFTPRHDAHLVPAVLCRVLRRKTSHFSTSLPTVLVNKLFSYALIPYLAFSIHSKCEVGDLRCCQLVSQVFLTFITNGPPLSPSQASPRLSSSGLKPATQTVRI